ncbi:MAG TPA: FAD-binding oxidoreductase, partial [Phycisphaerales bacterium]|nr:FAD-binding oxidoreductase [Phycisphaerales bacterium]
MKLPVLNNPIQADEGGLPPGLADGLVTAVGRHGQVRLSRHERMLYATDASMYQVEPLGVVVPRDAQGVELAVTWCADHGVAVLPRGGGTSLAGQCTGRAVVVDTSAALRLFGAVEETPGPPSAWAQAGCVIDEANAELARRGVKLFFPPDPATVGQACVGGCIGNNASGSRSIKYGRMVDGVLAIDAVLSSGARVVFEPGAARRDAVALKLAEGVAAIVRANQGLIRERFPKTLRRNAGYALDLVLEQFDRGVEPADLDLTKLLCGSEGTLAVTVAARLKLWPLPKAKGLLLASFASVDAAIDAVP